jgi:dCTP deaminase
LISFLQFTKGEEIYEAEIRSSLHCGQILRLANNQAIRSNIMAFWSSQTLEERIKQLIDPPPEWDGAIDCNAITLTVGQEIYITPELEEAHTRSKQLLRNNQGFLIPPGQFAFLMTAEVVRVPPDAMAFISMKATFKMKGLVNVSGFHADPGWDGPLIFAVFNAGPSPVHLHRGLPLFLIWYADLDQESAKRKSRPGPTQIPPATINNMTGGVNSIHLLDKRLVDESQTRRDEDVKLSNRIHDVEKTQGRNNVMLSIFLTIAISLSVSFVGYVVFRSAAAPVSSTQHNSGTPPP